MNLRRGEKMIKIVNLRNLDLDEDEVLIKVDRSNKILGNPFYMKSEKDRDKVCNQYQEWFDKQIEMKNEEVLNELRRIYKIAKNHKVALGCWCAPRRCHAETILNFLNKYL